MSRHATDWLGENLAEITKTSMPNGRGLGQDGMVLLFYFCDRANKENVFYMQVRTIMDETGLSMTAVKRLMTQFEQLGWITRTGQEIRYMGRGKLTPEYALTLVNENAQNTLTGAQKGAQLGTSTSTKPNKDKALPKKIELELEPQPQLEPQPGDLGSGGEFDELLGKCIKWELANYHGNAGAGLLRTWRNEYRPIVTRALRDRPTEDLVLWCVELRIPHRTGYQPKTHQTAPLAHLDTWTAPEWKQDELPGDPNCEHGCKGRTYHSVKVPTGKRLHNCKCQENGTYSLKDTQTTTDKVSADTDCPAPADTQSELQEQDYLATLNNKKELREVVRDMRSKYYLPADPF